MRSEQQRAVAGTFLQGARLVSYDLIDIDEIFLFGRKAKGPMPPSVALSPALTTCFNTSPV